jgi:hypothetical protein
MDNSKSVVKSGFVKKMQDSLGSLAHVAKVNSDLIALDAKQNEIRNTAAELHNRIRALGSPAKESFQDEIDKLCQGK